MAVVAVAKTATPQYFREGEHEHFAWDCSSVPRRIADLGHFFHRHLKDEEVHEDCIRAMQTLVKVPAVALMLPMPLNDDAKEALRDIKQAGIEIVISAETSFWESPRMLYILKVEPDETKSPVGQLQKFLEVVAEATLPAKPSDGPWLWSLHEPDVAAALLVCEAMGDSENCFWRLLRNMRILTPVCSLEQQRHVKEQYAPSTTYVLAWMNQYTQGIWPLLVLTVPFAIFVEEDRLNEASWEFYALQAVVILWAIVMIGRSRHRSSFVMSYEAGESKTWAADFNKVKITKRQILRRIMSQTGAGSEFAAMLNLTQNPDHHKMVHHRLWVAWCLLLSGLGCFICLVLAGLFLLFTMELKFILIYEWGDCYHLECHDPAIKHGFSGVLSMIGCDILLALTLNVATGELCKAFAYRIAKTWNFRSMILRQFVEHFTAITIDIVATIGMFSYLAFAFLPEWETTTPTEWWDSSGCDIFWDFQACRALRGCDADDQSCCSGTLFCARSKLGFKQRREVFEAWLGGLFVVAPFVEILMLFIVPLLAYLIHVHCELDRDLDEDADKDQPRRGCSPCACCCGFLRGLGRLVAFIFLLDGAVLGLPYIWRGFPFKAPKIIQENVEELGLEEEGEENGKDAKEAKEMLYLTDKDHPQGATVIGGLFGPLDQRLLRPMDPLDELKLLKLNFLVMVLFAPINPIGVIFQMLARQLDLHSRLPKLLMVRRRGFPTDNRLAHASQNLFGLMILPVAALWHTGLSLVSANPDLHTQPHGIVVIVWFAIGLGISAAALLGQWLVTRLFSWLRWGKVMLSRESSAIVGLEKEELEIEAGDDEAEREEAEEAKAKAEAEAERSKAEALEAAPSLTL